MTGELSIINRSGDFKVIWDSERPVEVENARHTFNDLKSKGYSAFAAGDKGERLGRIDKFDPEAGKYIMVPQMRGG